ncbi:MAG: hypothetical protein IPN71_01630 [Fibrobacteres bacterium]|nr:hypothetical protein [Fibrobacterota bacterium]
MSAKPLTYLLCALGAVAPAQAAKIAIDRERIVNLSSEGDAWQLFDEQDLAGDPKAGSGGKPVTEYTNGWIKANLVYPIETVVDLGAVHDLSDVWFYDINGADSLQVHCGDGKVWTEIVSKTTSAYMAWSGVQKVCTGRYVKIRVKSPSTAITEMVLYGTAKGAIEPLPNSVVTKKPTFGEMMGTNGFIDDDRTLLQVVGNLREYHSWQWDDGNGDPKTPAYPLNLFGWSPSWVRGTGWGWDFDEYYKDLSSKGISLQPVFQGTPAWMFGVSAGDSLKPMGLGKDSTQPASYLEHADYLFQFAARFGRTTHPAGDLRVDALNTAKSALGSVDWMEPWNEPDKDWKGPTGFFSPRVVAAMASAAYDGDQGRMGTKVGIKNADSKMRMALPGLIGPRLEFVKAIKWWADQNRAGSFPADALNFHHYCTDAGGQTGGEATTGISPEADDLKGRLTKIAQWRDRYLPGKELWLSEFGWDTHQGSKFKAPAIAGASGYEMQGRWLVRGFLEVAASGFQKAHQFMLRDTWDDSPGVFATSGLVHDKYDTLNAKYAQKVSWYYVNTLHKRMKDYRFEADESKNGIRIYRFSHATADSLAYAVWNPKDSAAAVDVSLSDRIAGSLREVRFEPGRPTGVMSDGPSILGGPYMVQGVTGRPVLLFGKSYVSGKALRPTAKLLGAREGFRADGRKVERIEGQGRLMEPAPVYGR